MADTSGRGPEDLFAGFPESLAICQAVQRAVAGLGEVSMATTKSQVAFRRHRGFAYVWRPGQYLSSDVPLVLSVVLPHEVGSDRIKQVVHPSPRVWMHHIELRDAVEIDEQVIGWLAEAHASAG